eukprot:CAMPEP_0178441468 /NCGR_PEP_ID=MMETSP0689_2-20121128/37481_1 /TAXON_ID=160604 /ORGANISM="Amphidinium massartii, Strain CS-259" /LENGTH=40 /DNA_ID= /DNA_START= /DNA_END= /DNA_ORIENTATION=
MVDGEATKPCNLDCGDKAVVVIQLRGLIAWDCEEAADDNA